VSADAIIRLIAGLAAVGLVAAPAATAVAAKIKAGWQNRALEGGVEKTATVTAKDLHIVLDLATRLKAAGLSDGVALCQQLIDVMLGNTPKAKSK
jgi:hypothetical protein